MVYSVRTAQKPFFQIPPEKTDPYIRVPTAFLRSNGLNYVKKQTSIKRALASFERDAFRPHFSKRGMIQAHFSHAPNRTVLRGFREA
jgi:RNA polymerase-interacting CarD/CdnL/TRCF family regulator